ncbi:MAG TPA: NAD-dependent epimerase/dehydratase family protein [Candidatus Eisenbacteria bacterium]|nr:NAD-dependent epimerase/dehydratase family protein [Candidatus Eisenbacteria bacterium]
MSSSFKGFRSALVTGGAGFVGLHLVDAALARGLRVRVLDNFSTASPSNLKPYARRIEVVRGDIRDPRAARRAVKGMDAVFHCAAIRSVMKSVEDPFLAHEVNATGALVMLDASSAAGVKHFLFTSTSAVYGLAVAPRQREDGKLRPMSPYGVAKLAAELYANYYFLEKGLPTTSVRIFNVYGPRQNPESRYSLAVPGILDRIRRGRPPVVDGTGRQARDFVYVGDLMAACFAILGNPKSYGKSYNIGSGRATSVNDLVRNLLSITGSRLKPVHGPRRKGDPERTCADVGLIRRELGWKPKVGLNRGLTEVVRWPAN